MNAGSDSAGITRLPHPDLSPVAISAHVEALPAPMVERIKAAGAQAPQLARLGLALAYEYEHLAVALAVVLPTEEYFDGGALAVAVENATPLGELHDALLGVAAAMARALGVEVLLADPPAAIKRARDISFRDPRRALQEQAAPAEDVGRQLVSLQGAVRVMIAGLATALADDDRVVAVNWLLREGGPADDAERDVVDAVVMAAKETPA